MKYVVCIVEGGSITKSFICNGWEYACEKAINLIVKEMVTSFNAENNGNYDRDWFEEMMELYTNKKYKDFIDTYNFNYDRKVLFYSSIETTHNKSSLSRMKNTSSSLMDGIINVFTAKDIIE